MGITHQFKNQDIVAVEWPNGHRQSAEVVGTLDNEDTLVLEFSSPSPDSMANPFVYDLKADGFWYEAPWGKEPCKIYLVEEDMIDADGCLKDVIS
jgi:hypothetical protein